MASFVSIPTCNEMLRKGVVLEWKVKEGAAVEAGDILAEVEVDKVVVEIEAPEAGVLLKQLVAKGEKVPAGTVLAIIGKKDEALQPLLKKARVSKTVKPDSAPGLTVLPEKKAGNASAILKKLTEAEEVEWSSVLGESSLGRILQKEIDAFVEKKEKTFSSTHASCRLPKLEQKDVPLTLMRETIADRLSESKRTIPHFYLTVEIDMQPATDLRNALKEAKIGSVSYNDMVIRAAALSLRLFPEMNASYHEEFIRLHEQIHIGMAVALPEGLATPVIQNADQKSLIEIAADSKDLALRAKEMKLKPEEYTTATFATTNMGKFDVEEFAAIINPPQTGILAVSSVADKPVVQSGEIKIGKRMKVTISCDHRVVDGALAGRYMKEFKKYLENPVLLIL